MGVICTAIGFLCIALNANDGGSDEVEGDVVCLLAAFVYGCYTTLIKAAMPDEANSYTSLFFGFLGLFNSIIFGSLLVLVWYMQWEVYNATTVTGIILGLMVAKALIDNGVVGRGLCVCVRARARVCVLILLFLFLLLLFLCVYVSIMCQCVCIHTVTCIDRCIDDCCLRARSHALPYTHSHALTHTYIHTRKDTPTNFNHLPVFSDFLWAKAVTLLSPTVVTIGLALQIPMTIVTDAMFGKAYPNPLSLFGAAFMIFGFVGVALPRDPACITGIYAKKGGGGGEEEGEGKVEGEGEGEGNEGDVGDKVENGEGEGEDEGVIGDVLHRSTTWCGWCRNASGVRLQDVHCSVCGLECAGRRMTACVDVVIAKINGNDSNTTDEQTQRVKIL